MPSFTTVVEDSAPFLTYDSSWRAGTSSDDGSADRYSESSFTVTNVDGARFSWTFYGTSCSIYGAKRGNHGNFRVTVNGQTYPTTSAQSGTSLFGQSLFSTTLDPGLHTIELTNSGTSYRDIDWVQWDSSIGTSDEQLIVNTIQDSHPAWQYEPSEAWGTNPPNVGTFSGADGHATNSVGATAKLTFQGGAIAIYGPAGPKSATGYSVKIDQGDARPFSAFKSRYRSRQLLYWQGNLGEGSHNVTISLSGASAADELLAIDYAEIFTTPSLGGEHLTLEGLVVTPLGTPAPSPDTSDSPPIGLIIGIAVTGFLALVALVCLLLLFILYKKGRFNFSSPPKHAEGAPDAYPPPIQHPDANSTAFQAPSPPLIHRSANPSTSQSNLSYYPSALNAHASSQGYAGGHSHNLSQSTAQSPLGTGAFPPGGAHMADTSTLMSGSSGSEAPRVLQPSRYVKNRDEGPVAARTENAQDAPPAY